MKRTILLLIMILSVGIIVPFRVNAEVNLFYKYLKNKAVRDDTSSEFVTSSSGIDFSEVSSDTNGKGLYMIGSTANKTNPILYYRGNISNNNVLYSGFCWEIIRTTDTGGIKLEYAGVPNGGKCNNTGAALAIGKYEYNDSNVDKKYGWMYNLGEGDVNLIDSSAKTVIDNWFRDNMNDYVKELEDTVWCNDRSQNAGEFVARERLEAGNPTIECANIDDSFTVFSSKGNKKLTYPTAIINADEATYGGEVLKKTQTETFINKAYSYWSMTPYTTTKNMYPNSKGMLNMYTFTYNAGLRPMISIRPTAILISGDGTQDNPYIVEVEKQYRIITDEYTTASKEESETTDTISFTPKDRPGYKYLNTKIYDTNDSELDISINNNSFRMPNKDVVLKSSYRELKQFYNLSTSNSEVTIPEESVEEEQEATFKVNVPHGYKVSEVVLKDEQDNVLDITCEENNDTYTFIMPNKNVVIEVSFEELPKHEVEIEDGELDDGEIYYVDDKVTFKVKSKAGFKVKKVYLVDKDGNVMDVDVTNSNGMYSFTMPDEDVKIMVDYEEDVKNPNTGDNILISIIVLLISGVGLIGGCIYSKKNRITK